MTSCDNGNGGKSATTTPTPPVKPWEIATVNFKALAASFPNPTIEFSPNATLPVGVTYKLADDKGNSWEPGKNGFNGQVYADEYSTDGNVTFTQTFYLNGQKITNAGSTRTVVINVFTMMATVFSAKISDTSDSNTVTLVHP